jgi:cytochrome b6-f complex iron-sulfur subunit
VLAPKVLHILSCRANNQPIAFFFLCFSSHSSYLIVKEDKTLESYGLNAVCTHLGCVVPWSAANNKFMCPCHGSQYSPDGAVVRGPAPLPLALAHCDVADDGKILFSPWTEADFRTGEKGWWN